MAAIKWFIAITVISVANGQIPGFGNYAKRVQNAAAQGPKTPIPGSAAGFNAANATLLQKPLKIAQDVLDNNWKDFTQLTNKTYPTLDVEFLRKGIFSDNLNVVTKFNENFASGLSHFTLKLNQFSDLLLDEFNKLLNGFKGGNRKVHKGSIRPSTYVPPAAVEKLRDVDWRQKGGVSPVKYQGTCASCHAFSATGAVEGHNFRKNGVLVELSPQNVLDCPPTKNYQSFGCTGGGYVDEDLKYIWENIGVDKEEAYTYEAKDGTCRFDKNAVGANVTGYVEIPEGDEEAMEMVVSTLGPVSVGVDASQMTFQFYSQGVYYDEKCKNKGENINHAMLVVGYGEEADGEKYWLVKNSYGTQWGMDGYIKMAKNKNNHCGIATSAVYPLV